MPDDNDRKTSWRNDLPGLETLALKIKPLKDFSDGMAYRLEPEGLIIALAFDNPRECDILTDAVKSVVKTIPSPSVIIDEKKDMNEAKFTLGFFHKPQSPRNDALMQALVEMLKENGVEGSVDLPALKDTGEINLSETHPGLNQDDRKGWKR